MRKNIFTEKIIRIFQRDSVRLRRFEVREKKRVFISRQENLYLRARRVWSSESEEIRYLEQLRESEKNKCRKNLKYSRHTSRMKKRTILTVAATFLAISIGLLSAREFELGPCYLQFSETCSNNSIQFFLFSSEFPEDAPLRLDKVRPKLPLGRDEIAASRVKLIIHGYGGHLDFNGSKHVRNGELRETLKFPNLKI